MLMDALSRLSNSDTNEKPKSIFQNSWKSIWDISVHNLTFERIPFKKKSSPIVLYYSKMWRRIFSHVSMCISYAKNPKCARNAKNPFPYLHFHVTMWTGEVIVMKARLQVLPTSTPSVHVIIIFVIARLQESNCPHRRALKKQFCGTSLENLEKTPTLLPLIPLLLLRKLYSYLLIRNISTKYSLPTCAPVTYMLINGEYFHQLALLVSFTSQLH